MHTKTLLAGTALTALSMIPSCPAPMAPAIISAVIGGVVAPLAGGVIAVGLGAGGVFSVPQCCKKRDVEGRLQHSRLAARQEIPPGVSDEVIEQCRMTNVNRQVTLTRTGEYCMLGSFLPK